GQDAGLIERADFGHGRVGHGLAKSRAVERVGRVLSDWRRHAKCHIRRRQAVHAVHTARVSQLAMRSVPPIGAANGKRRWPANWRMERSPANSVAATTKPNAAKFAVLP